MQQQNVTDLYQELYQEFIEQIPNAYTYAFLSHTHLSDEWKLCIVVHTQRKFCNICEAYEECGTMKRKVQLFSTPNKELAVQHLNICFDILFKLLKVAH